MRCLERNKLPCFYALCTGETEEIDKYGMHTGRKYPTYSAPVSTAVNIRAARGEAFLAANGIETEYTRRIVTCDELPWDVDTILWIDREPYETVDSETKSVPHNYVVTNVSRSINSVTYELREVQVSL